MQTIFGLTGPMAAGKNAACDILSSKGFACVDADVLAHEAIEIAKPQIIDYFGSQILNNDGTINRQKLAPLVFKTKKNLAAQEAIIHPIVDTLIHKFITEHSTQDIIINATVLYKVSAINQCKAILFITAPFCTRLKRARKRDNFSLIHIAKRFLSQRKLFSKYVTKNSDTYKVRNYGSLKELEKNLEKVLSVL
ncbi:MAG: dephospho-CoA kinase [Treponema sp. CETP13]|nr:MAG: dephospho-CoA kinase [Treponema sp. CETP13]